jgi:hypothetical protein
VTALSRLDRLLIAADVVFRLADDEDRAAAIVANAIRQYLDGEAPSRRRRPTRNGRRCGLRSKG